MKTYSTQELSVYFGVSRNTILHWINEGRFIPVSGLTLNNKIQIPENTLWISRTGKCIEVVEVVNDWFEENKQTKN